MEFAAEGACAPEHSGEGNRGNFKKLEPRINAKYANHLNKF